MVSQNEKEDVVKATEHFKRTFKILVVDCDSFTEVWEADKHDFLFHLDNKSTDFCLSIMTATD